MKCEKVKKELELMFEGGQPGAGALSHIKNCAKCSAEYDTILKIINVFSGRENVKVPAGFNRGVWDRIGEPSPSLLDNVFRPVFALPVAAAAALVLFLVFFSRSGIDRKQNELVLKPPVVKEKIADKNAIKQGQAINKEQAPVTAQGSKDQAPGQQAANTGIYQGKKKEILKSIGAGEELYVKAKGDKNLSAAISLAWTFTSSAAASA